MPSAVRAGELGAGDASVIFVRAVMLAVLASTASGWGAETKKPFREWTAEDFARQGEIIAGPTGAKHDQFIVRDWNKPTLVDLRKAIFSANEDGPFRNGKLPDQWPVGDAFQTLPEASSGEKYPVVVRDVSVWDKARAAWLTTHLLEPPAAR